MPVQTKVSKAYFVGVHRLMPHAGKPGEIIGVVVVESDHPPRPSYHVRFEDSTEAYIPIFEEAWANYEIIREEDVRVGQIPSVTE